MLNGEKIGCKLERGWKSTIYIHVPEEVIDRITVVAHSIQMGNEGGWGINMIW